MSVAFADYDGDGHMDAFVTNDSMENFLFHNLGNGTFEEIGLRAGVALPDQGRPVSSMGADFRDYDNDGLPDIVVTALANETFPLFRNLGKGMFADATYASRLGSLSIHHSGWGIGLFDFNNDGWKDLFTAQSHVNDRIEALESARYKEANGVFLNTGRGTFVDVSVEAGQNSIRAHRGSAYADLNGDGKIDGIVSCLQEPVEIWENVSADSNHWVVLKLVGVRSNRDGIGARIRIGDQVNQMTSAVSYASSSHAGVHFGLGKLETIARIEILWPSGTKQVLTDVRANQVLTVREN